LREISLHIIDIAENGIDAGGDLICIFVDEDRCRNLLTIKISDNGSGISPEIAENVTDPFVTSRTTRRIGLGLSLLETAARRCDGDFIIESEPGKGTCITATFKYGHIDRAPVGDMAASLSVLMFGNPKTDFVYTHIIDEKQFNLDTREIKKEFKVNSLSDPLVIHRLTQFVKEGIDRLKD